MRFSPGRLRTRAFSVSAAAALVMVGLAALVHDGLEPRVAHGATTTRGTPASACAALGLEGAPQRPIPLGAAPDLGGLKGGELSKNARIVAIAADPKGRGYWLVTGGGRVLSFGSAGFHGSARNLGDDRIVGMIATRDGRGYLLASRAGRVFAFGDAHIHRARTRRRTASPIVGLAASPDDQGFWLAAANGSVSRSGDAAYLGSASGQQARRDIVAIVPTPSGGGYWLAASSGGILRYGDARYYGSAISRGAHIVGMAATRDGRGYWLVAADGTVFRFGDARYYGSAGASAKRSPIVSIADLPDGRGYWLLPTIAGAGTGLPAPGPGLVPCRVTAIGDSVMLDAQAALQAAIPGIDVEAAVSRQWDAGVALAQQLRSEGDLGAIVVIDLGTNGPVTWQQFTNMMAVLAGASRVVFVTIHVPSVLSWSQSVNSTLEQGVARYPRAVLADFNTLADRNPQWFGADGVHMAVGGPGDQAMATLIKSAIAEPPPN